MFGRRCVFAPLAALLLLGCQPSPPSAQPAVGRAESSAAATPTSQPLALVPISVAYAAVTPTVAPVWVAAELGFGQQYGLDISPLATKTAPILQAALASGDVQYGQTGLPASMTARAGGSDVVFLAATTNRAAADLVTRPTITTTDALRGKTLGVQSIGGTVYFRALLGLARLGLDPDRDAITIVQSGDDPTSAAALLSGAIDGAALAYTGSRPVKAQGYHAWDLGALNVPEVTGIISSRAVVRERPTDTRHLLQAIGASLAYIKSIDTDPVARERVAKVVAAGTGGTEEDVLFELDASRAQLPVTMRVRREEAQELHDLVAASQPAVRDVKVEDVLDETLLDQLQSEGFFDTLARR